MKSTSSNRSEDHDEVGESATDLLVAPASSAAGGLTKTVLETALEEEISLIVNRAAAEFIVQHAGSP
ncbi:hypothetical protein [Nonomuraea sp. NPDC049400]|uniref:hypothetical protein n=1 Tax=Nonomuraea sp. NPDC049400 TaxID=3364352 RepID=UPI0037AAA266